MREERREKREGTNKNKLIIKTDTLIWNTRID